MWLGLRLQERVSEQRDNLLEAGSKHPLGPNLCVGRSGQVLKILEYSSGLTRAAALTLNPIERFETASVTTQGG